MIKFMVVSNVMLSCLCEVFKFIYSKKQFIKLRKEDKDSLKIWTCLLFYNYPLIEPYKYDLKWFRIDCRSKNVSLSDYEDNISYTQNINICVAI